MTRNAKNQSKHNHPSTYKGIRHAYQNKNTFVQVRGNNHAMVKAAEEDANFNKSSCGELEIIFK